MLLFSTLSVPGVHFYRLDSLILSVVSRVAVLLALGLLALCSQPGGQILGAMIVLHTRTGFVPMVVLPQVKSGLLGAGTFFQRTTAASAARLRLVVHVFLFWQAKRFAGHLRDIDPL